MICPDCEKEYDDPTWSFCPVHGEMLMDLEDFLDMHEDREADVTMRNQRLDMVDFAAQVCGL